MFTCSSISTTGVFSVTKAAQHWLSGTNSSGSTAFVSRVSLDASIWSELYGKNSHVRPLSLKAKFYIRY